MKIFLLFIALTLANLSFGQLTGSKTIPGDYATIAAAISDLNAQGVGPGGVTFDVAAGYTEPFSNLTDGLITTLTGSATAPIVFQKSGIGDNPVITAATPGTTPDMDFIICIAGTDYVTFDGIDLQENTFNTTPTQQMEWGYALVKASGTAPFDGCQHVVIKNCNISLNKSNTASVGIYSGCHTSSSLTELTLTAVTDATSYCKFFENTITNVNSGINISSFWAPAPYSLLDQGNEIGNEGANYINNFGSGSEAYGIRARCQNGIIIANQHITGTVESAILVGAIFIESSGDMVSMHDNLVSLTLTGSDYYGGFYGIICYGGLGNSNTISIINNEVSNCSFASAQSVFYGIYFSGMAMNLNCNGNSITNNLFGATSDAGWGIFAGIQISGGGSGTLAGSVWDINNNIVSGNHREQSLPEYGELWGIYVDYMLLGCETIHTNGNLVDNNLNTNGRGFMGLVNGAMADFKTMTGNAVTNNLGGTYYAIGGIKESGGKTVTFSYNTVSNLTAMGYAWMEGISVSSYTDTRVFNNIVSDLKAPVSTNPNSIIGMSVSGQGGSEVGLYYNTIYLDAVSSSATTFGSTGLSVNVASPVELRNNIVVNTSAPVFAGGDAYTVAYQRSSSDLSTYSSTSGNNDFYAGVPGANNLIYFDGTNTDLTMASFKARVAPRDASSFSEIPPYINAASSPYDLHIDPAVATQCERGGAPVTSPVAIGDDIDGNPRNAGFPDVGADEFSGILLDLLPPSIVYTALLNTSLLTARSLTATINDPSGVPSSGPGLPVLYWRIGSGAYTGVQGVPAGGQQFTFTFGGGVATGDVVSYFIAAQDGASIPHVGTFPAAGGSGFTFNPPACSTPPSVPSSYSVQPALAGNVTVGNGGNYPSLTGAGGLFYTINNSVLTGNVAAAVISDLTEPGTYALNQWTEETGGSDFSVTIRPDGSTERLIAGNVSSSMILFNGADRVTMDGRNGGTGRNLRFRNINTSGPTFLFQNDATFNTIRNCYIEGSNNNYDVYPSGVVNFSGTTGATGNSHNTIMECVLRDLTGTTGYPNILFYSYGTRWKENSSNTISDNQFMNFQVAGIYIGNEGNGKNWTITGNSIFSTITSTQDNMWLSGILFMVDNTSVSGTVISSNYIGGQSEQCGGPAWTNNSPLYQFNGINVELHTGTFSPQTTDFTVQNNIVQNIHLANTGAVPFLGIRVYAGWGTNIVGTGNTVGHPSVPNSIIVAGSGQSQPFNLSVNYGDITAIDNEVANINFSNSDYSATNAMIDIYGDQVNIKQNRIHDISCTNNGWLNGLSVFGTYGLVEKNEIYNLMSGSSSSSWGSVNGLNVSSYVSTPSLVITRNRIYNLVNLNSGIYASLKGIQDNTANGIYTNNMVSLGENTGNQVAITGIDISLSVNRQIDHNSVLISGTAGAGTNKTYCFNNSGWGSSTTTLRDNIFVNTRSGPGSHYAIATTNSAGSMAYDYNDLYTSAAPLARWGSNDKADLGAWKAASGQDIHSISVDPAFTSVYNLLPTNIAMGKSGTYLSSVPVDFSGALRSDPPDQGAYEYTDVPLVTTSPANLVTSYTATLHGIIDANDLEVDSWFDYGLTESYDESVAGTPSSMTGSDPTPFSAEISGLLPATKYHFRARVVSTSGKIGYGEDLTFTTSHCPVPDPAGSISGPAEVCAGSLSVVYSVADILNATTYFWTVPPEMNIISGIGTNTITVERDSAAFTGMITVQALNDCGAGTVSPSFGVTSVFKPPPHGQISGNNKVCQGSTGEVYFISPVLYADGYTWSVPPGATIASGQGTTMITVDFSPTASNGKVSVYASNVCGNSSTNPKKNVNVYPIPDPPKITYDKKKKKLSSNEGHGNQWYLNGSIIPGATNKTYTPVQSGTYTDIVTDQNCSSEPSNAIYVNLSGKSAEATLPADEEAGTGFIVYPNPNQGNFNYKITVAEEGNFTIQVCNSIGMRLFEQKDLHVDGTYIGEINLRPLNNGLYIVYLRGQRTFLIRKIVVRY